MSDIGSEKGGNPFALANHQSRAMLQLIDSGIKGFPRSLNTDGSVRMVNPENWTSGFFPGILWMLFENSGDPVMRRFAENSTERLEAVQYFTGHHDTGFIINSSYGHGYRITRNPRYCDVMVRAAGSLISRYRPAVGLIQSLEAFGPWQCPVLIDNLMNLELLFTVHALTGESEFFEIAVNHAVNTLKYHYRPDGSCYHLVDFEKETGKVINRGSHQGLHPESVWARGQAWGVYGCAMIYRFTRDTIFLQQAIRSAAFLLSHHHYPEDGVPYWDYNATGADQPRDSSAAAIFASALYELGDYSPENRKILSAAADRILQSLSSEAYLAKPGGNGFFLLKHGTGSMPKKTEIDVSLIYGDYYYLEALIRKNLVTST